MALKNKQSVPEVIVRESLCKCLQDKEILNDGTVIKQIGEWGLNRRSRTELVCTIYKKLECENPPKSP